MLICRLGAWHIESDGMLSATELASLDGLRAIEAERAAQAADARQTLGRRVRELKRRAWRRGHAAGKRAALCAFVGGAASVALAARSVEARLTQIVLGAVTDIVGQLPPSAALTQQLRRALAVSQSQRLVSVRVAPSAFDDAVRLLATIERELGMSLCSVLADAGLPRHSCVIETERGVIDGGLAVQLRALECGIRDGVADALRGDDPVALRASLALLEHDVRDAVAALSGSRVAEPPTPSMPIARAREAV
ncbi:FliH/SctL family protein [Paraburkholderia sp.]|uniref:FliH/SctL family protein n=1 Tax=Paraburkholderia sp. TaxID=1926495 RepID=UPI0023837998|nr:FliH/SctL family protein [Paraburkholderia sp.]MDE1184510.1 FliH/SctL family protein [Paraburkholderia sp.]